MPGTAYRLQLVALLLTALAAPPAHAKDDAATAQAKERWKSGTRHYDLAEYAAALDDFKEAYRLREDPAFVFNIAQCHRFLGNHEDAIRFYQTYLRQSPAASNRADVEALILGEEKALAEVKEKAAREEEARRRAEPLRQPPPKPWYDDTAGWVMAATGLALAGGGAGVLGWGATLRTPGTGATTVVVQDYRNKQTLSWIVGGVATGLGAGLLVAGVVKLALHARADKAPKATLLFAPVEGGAIAGAAGAF